MTLVEMFRRAVILEAKEPEEPRAEKEPEELEQYPGYGYGAYL